VGFAFQGFCGVVSHCVADRVSLSEIRRLWEDFDSGVRLKTTV